MNFQANNPTFIIKTLGCKVNQYESEIMRENLLKNGYAESSDKEFAEFYIINSCTVTHRADRDARRLIRHFNKINPDAGIIVAGCYAESDNDRKILATLPGVMHILKNKEKDKVGDVLKSHNKDEPLNFKSALRQFKDHDRVFIKIQDGCNHGCSYCKVALVRGASRSRSENEILDEVRNVLGKGCKEIVLTGICLGAWGMDLEKPLDISYILKKIKNIDGDYRIRLSSIEPAYVTGELIDLVYSSDNICKHFHIPLQSGDDRILRMMQRGYNTKKFEALLKKIRKKMPNAGFTTDLMIGFPGEDDKIFGMTYKFIKKIKPSRIHIFSYSEREGTLAFNFKNIINNATIKNRINLIKKLSYNLHMDFVFKLKKNPQKVLIESKKDKYSQLLTGYTDTYVKVFIDGPDTLLNSFVKVKIMDINQRGIFASPAQP